ncbi:hypothetical protein SDC9_41943 [bioreactor metagenome]|uniref:VWFA domain-containing protein n=1 Tax=bioreactor metagenome TaxID=1076179 RepID=A0A644VWI1_9ZZZZ
MKTILFNLFCFLLLGNIFGQTPMLKGRVLDKETREPIPFANIIWCDGKTGALTDMEGDFIVADSAGCDTLIITYVGYNMQRLYVPSGISDVTIEMSPSAVTLDVVEVVDYAEPLVSYDYETTTVYSEEIRSIPAHKSKSVRRDKDEGFADYAPAEYSKGDAAGASSDVPSTGISAGQLTAGEVNDFTKWKLWEDINTTDLASYNNQWKLYPENRFVVQVTNEKKLPVHNATAVLMDESGSVVWSARTDNTGKAELWAGLFDNKAEKKYSINVIYDNKSYPIKKAESFQNGINFIELPVKCSEEKNVDIAFMIDATGSMGDEIAYLQSELSDVVERVKDSLPGNNIRLAIVFYRDMGDAYVVIHKDFTSNIPEAIKYLRSNGAGGGGDYPEAVDSALFVSVNELSWSEDAVARILFPVLDAPPHETQQVINNLHNTIPRAASKGIRITPLACSGVNKSTEYLLRSMALATNGTYVFLTDHSGIGNPHIAPTTDDYKVEKLNDALVRIIVSFSEAPECDKPLVDNTLQPDTAVMTMPAQRDTVVPVDSNTLVGVDSLKIDTVIPVEPQISWRYYPNPTAGPMTVEIINLPEAKEGFLYLTDLTGKLLARYEVKESNIIQVDISMYPTGTYYLTFFYGEESKLCAPVVLMH